ncbi:MAG: FliO/MopB family protein [bacterium]
MTPNFSAVLWFLAILAAIPLVLWWLRRTPLGARMASGPMRSISALPLSASQKLVTVGVGLGEERRWLVLGVAQGGISLLYTLTPTEESKPPTPVTPAEGFAQLLNRLRNQDGGPREPR